MNRKREHNIRNKGQENWKMDILNTGQNWVVKEIHKKERRLLFKERSLTIGTRFYWSGRGQPGQEVQRFC